MSGEIPETEAGPPLTTAAGWGAGSGVSSAVAVASGVTLALAVGEGAPAVAVLAGGDAGVEVLAGGSTIAARCASTSTAGPIRRLPKGTRKYSRRQPADGEP